MKVQVLSRAPNEEADRLVCFFIWVMLATLLEIIQNYHIIMMDILRPTPDTDVFNSTKRFQQIDALRHNLQLDGLDATFGQEIQVSEETPTMGIEIEMNWMQALPELGNKWEGKNVRPDQLDKKSLTYKEFSRTYNRLDSRLKPILKEVQRVIPRVGADAYWEFSFLPSKHVGVTIAEVQTLYDAGILHDDIHYATHMTVASINNDRDAFAFLCGLELSGGSTEERIKTAINSMKGSYARKGFGGLLERRPEELMGRDTKGYEFRTLAATSRDQMESLLLTAHDLALLYSQDKEGWLAYRTHMESYLRENGLELQAWPSPRVEPAQWLKYAALLPNKKDA